MAKRGSFILIEGGEASGKSTISQMIIAWLEAREIKTVFTHEPGGLGSDIPEIVAAEEHIRKILVDSDLDIPIYSQLWLFLTSRLIHMEKKVIPALESGSWVVTDRLHLSTLVYQGVAGGIPLSDILSIEAQARVYVDPDLAIVLIADIDKVMKRLSGRQVKTKQDAWGRDKQLELIKGYQRIAEMFGYPVINSSGEPSETFAEVVPYLEELINSN